MSLYLNDGCIIIITLPLKLLHSWIMGLRIHFVAHKWGVLAPNNFLQLTNFHGSHERLTATSNRAICAIRQIVWFDVTISVS